MAPVLITDKGPLSCVGALVPDEMTGLGERAVAPVLVTYKGFFPCVGTLVGNEMTGLGERP
ncbi:hypothetical protein, partial [Sansalvadorimonas verongulae]|uniref:hypothetical protein n=1 Tax=Sansalvadorimonas verongulae TaxID=2172824 RepID=UPI001E59BF7B